MSVNIITLKGISKKLNQFGTGAAKLSTVVELLRQACESDLEHSNEKLAQFTLLMNCARSNVQDKLRLCDLKEASNEDAEILGLIRQNEQQLDAELFEFCQTFNEFCRLTGVVQYFSTNENGEGIWKEIIEYFAEQQRF